MRAIIIAALGAALAGPVAAQSVPEGVAWVALRDINDAYADLDDPTNRPPLATQAPEGMIRAVDFTPDGRADWLIDYGPAEMSLYCGTGGCRQRLYVSLGGDGLMRVFDQQAHRLTFYEADGERRIEAEVHHALCFSEAGGDCRFAFAWDPDARRLVERPTRDGRAIIAVGAFSPIDTSDNLGPNDDAPSTVADIWFTSRTTCSSVYNDDGIEVRRAMLQDVPDIDGDGVRDWIVERPSPCQASPGDLAPYVGFEVWLTRGQDAMQAYVSPAETFPELDVSRSPAVVVIRPPCDSGETCSSARMRWDAEAGRLVE